MSGMPPLASPSNPSNPVGSDIEMEDPLDGFMAGFSRSLDNEKSNATASGGRLLEPLSLQLARRSDSARRWA